MDRKGRFPIGDQIEHSYAVEKVPFRPRFCDRAIRCAHPVEKVDFFYGMRGSDYSIEKLFEAHRISHQPTKQTITPYNSSDAGLTATILLLATTRRGTSCNPPASSAYRHPMAAVRVIDYLFAPPLLQQSCCCPVLTLATLEVQRHNRDDEEDEGLPCAKRTLCSRKKARRRRARAQQAARCRPSRTREQDTKQLLTDFRLPFSRVSNAPRKSTKTKEKLQTRSD